MNQISINALPLLRCFLPQPALNVPEPVREKLDSEESESVVSRMQNKPKDCLIFKLVFLFQLAAAEKWHESLRTAVGARALSPLVLDTRVFNLTPMGSESRLISKCQA